MPVAIGQQGEIELPVHAVSASTARLYIARVLTNWNLPQQIDTATLIVSEVVTNAIKTNLALLTATPIIFSTQLIRDFLMIEVSDASDEAPQLVNAGLDDVGGRGLQLVTELAISWGHRPLKEGGKVVWASLDAVA